MEPPFVIRVFWCGVVVVFVDPQFCPFDMSLNSFSALHSSFLMDSGLMLVIELVSKWEIFRALWSLVLLDPV